MITTPKEIGLRLKEVRNYFNLTQMYVAKKTGLGQNIISRLENGKNISSDKFVLFLVFYSQYINIDVIFNDKFALYEDHEDNSVKISKNLHIHSIAIEKLKIMDKEKRKYNEQYEIQMKNIIDLLQQ